MKKNLLAIGVLAIVSSVQAQNVLLHVDDTAKMYVSAGTLVYNGGGLQSRGSGVIDLHGNMMVVGTTADGIKTISTNGTGGTSVTPNPTNVILRINTPGTPVTSTYGQLYIKGIPQNNITGSVDKEYAATKHGAYQQLGVPFFNKTFASLSSELGGVFNESRWSGREILKWSNTNLRFDGSIIPGAPIPNASVPGITIGLNTTTALADRTAYYAVGTSTYVPTTLRTVKGRPFADGDGLGSVAVGTNVVSLTPSTIPASFGTGGNNKNVYQEKYNTYIGDAFDPTPAWTAPTFGKYLYQYSNPFLTNIDLSMIGFVEAGATTDNNNISNIWGVIVDPQNVTWNSSTGGTATYAETQKVTFDPSGKPMGNLPSLVIKPLNTFKIKLRTVAAHTLDFDNLRRFAFTARTEDAANPYSVTASKNTNSGSIKQLGVLALDAAGNQIGETFYVVAPHFTTGNITNPSLGSVQAMTSTTSAMIQTFEESVNGGVDSNYSSAYRLYINEANENNYKGKRIDLSIFGQNVASLKFEVRDDTVLIPNNTHTLSSGTGFYYSVGNGQAAQIYQGAVIPVNTSNFGLYYGTPQTQGALNTGDLTKKSRTLVTYNPNIDHYIVRFDSDWKSASIEVFDASGKLVISEKSVKTDSDYVIKLDSSLKAFYVVKVVGNDGTIVNSKILIK